VLPTNKVDKIMAGVSISFSTRCPAA